MTLKKITALAGIALCLLPIASMAAKPAAHKAHTKMVTASTYECQTCHMKFTAAQAKKDHYKDPMDGGTLLPVKPAAKASSKMDNSMGGGSMGGMKM